MTTTSDKPWPQLAPFFAFFILLFVITYSLPFFSDKDLLFSKLGYWLPENHFSLVLPTELDAGYPPALGYLLALVWELTGKSLFSAHLLMLPFTLGIVWLTRNLVNYFFNGRFVVAAMLLIFADTTLLSQTILFSTDLVMLFFMLLALYAVISHKKIPLALAITGLLFSHMRGLQIALTIGIFDLFLNFNNRNRNLIRITLPYLPALALFGAWMIFHYNTTGWILHHPESPWLGCYETVDAKGFFRNMLIYVWRLADLGKLFLWIPVLSGVFWVIRGRLKTDATLKQLFFLLVIMLVVNAPTMLFYKMLNNHRYLLPVYYILAMLSAYLLFTGALNGRLRKVLIAVVFSGLISGSFWVYPGKIANGWDATLAHIPYHHLRARMIAHIEEQHIPFENIGSEVPNVTPNQFILVNEDKRTFRRASLQHHPYVFYSNIFNMFTNEELDELKNEWIVEQEYRCLQVYVTLYRNPRFEQLRAISR
ncbi:MAG: hypothetical protein JXA72_04705 [Bacteroidales bacterium]|nr:hypothetical protein [Bacteroidales bacterium]